MSGGTSDQTVDKDPTRKSGGGTGRRKDPLIDTVLADRYRIIELLGRGGMGVVYKARHELMDRLVAIKMILPQLVSDDASFERFKREAKAASRFTHPNIITIHDFGMTPDTEIPYLVMDYLEGVSLADVIDKEKQVSVQRTVRIFEQVCDALAHAHEQGVIHRDLKPSNIMLIKQGDKTDFVKVLDFGVAKMDTEERKLTGSGEVFGSPVYMSPEQCRGDTLDGRSDVYALGCVIYETLTGKLPIQGQTPIETLAKQINGSALPFKKARPDLYIPERLEEIIFKALSKERDKRQASMHELKTELLQTGMGASAGLPTPTSTVSMGARSSAQNAAQPDIQSQPATAPPNNTRVLLAIVAVVLVAALAATAYAFTVIFKPSAQTAQPSNPPAQQNAIAPQKTEPQPVQNSESTTESTATTATPSATPVTSATSAATSPAATPAVTPSAAPVADTPAETRPDLPPRLRPRKMLLKRAAARRGLEPLPPDFVPRRHRRQSDWGDYAGSHEHHGDPTDLPVRSFGSE